MLKPGQGETLSFTILPADLASFNMQRSPWISDAGKYLIKTGASGIDFKQNDSFNLANEIAVEKCANVLVPQAAIDEFNGK